MRWIDYYAIVATAITLVIIGFFMRLLRKRGPSRGFGAAQGALVAVGAMSAAVLHGAIVSGIALSISQNPVTWTAAGIHGLIILGAIIRVKTT